MAAYNMPTVLQQSRNWRRSCEIWHTRPHADGYRLSLCKQVV